MSAECPTCVAYARDALEQECAEVAATPEGGRNSRLNNAGMALGSLVPHYLSLEEVVQRLEAAGIASGLEERETQRTVMSGTTDGIQEKNVRKRDAKMAEVHASHNGRAAQPLPRLAAAAPEQNSDDHPLYVDVAALLDQGMPDPPAPTVLHRQDGHALFYDGRVNWLFGDPEAGKTWLALAACVEALQAGQCVLVVDMDHNGVEAVVTNLLLLGAPISALRDPGRFRYTEPDNADHLDRVVADVKTWRPAVAVVDSIGELMLMLGKSSNDADELTAAHSRVLKPMAKAGAAVLPIDHLAKGADSRQYGAAGSHAKRRVVGGSSIRVTIKDPFTPGRGGAAYLAVHKDRHGGLRAVCPPGREPPAGMFVLQPVPEGLSWHVTAPRAGDTPSGRVTVDDLAALDGLDPPPTSQRDVANRLHWGGKRALDALNAWREMHALPLR
jgi:hypothetical protein